jgi:hypothetical protein
MKTLETVAREIERQMYGQWNYCVICESDFQRLCPHTGLAEMARATERLDRKVDAIKKTVGGRSMNDTQTLTLIHALAWPLLIWLLSTTWSGKPAKRVFSKILPKSSSFS